jgi:hypothetical protein
MFWFIASSFGIASSQSLLAMTATLGAWVLFRWHGGDVMPILRNPVFILALVFFTYLKGVTQVFVQFYLGKIDG